ncbi:DUF6580 family putative transport protein [Adhaeretor mobilis]|uniref:ECF transporter S component n=1 Tax=Adhaeretor mobilis TaxID=1930276 RepID=A0A517MPH2_9BACT|nr:DUF6580 family putative transport protein [Adhaeretor mobilis]QDS96781.1 hypothetical protein HG15A2_00390 [Adhaeretor mobilis]
MNRDTLRELSVFTLLLTLGVVGRWAQPAWNFTPLAAVAMMGGYYFRSLLPAVLLPIGMLVVSDLALLGHDSLAVQASVYVAISLPWVLGRMLRSRSLGGHHTGRTAIALGCGVASSLAFFAVTNFAVWGFQRYYPHSWAGLVECYAAALPFFRTMLAGDLAYVGTLFGGLSAVEWLAERRQFSPSQA